MIATQSIWGMINDLASNGVLIGVNLGAPVNGTSGTGAGVYGPGSLLLDATNKVLYINTNTLLSPTWSAISAASGFVQYAPFANTALFYELAQAGVTAGSTQTQAGATQLTGQTVSVTTVTTLGDGVKLPASAAGAEILVINKGANAMRVYGSGADTVDDQTNTVGVLQMAGSAVIYICAAAGNWYSEGLATGFGGPGLQTLSFTPTITANATQTQAAATALISMVNRVSTVVTAGDGVKLPTSSPGLQVTVINRSANPVQVYGTNPDTINGITTTIGVTQGINTQATYTCSVAGNWEVPISSLVSSSPLTIGANQALLPHAQHVYAINKGSACALTLGAPTAGTDDGNEITVTSDSAFAHTITATGILDTGSAAVNAVTFNPFKGSSVTLMALNARWKVISGTGYSVS